MWEEDHKDLSIIFATIIYSCPSLLAQMSDSTFVSHIVSQTRENILFLQDQGCLTVADATAVLSKLPAVPTKATGVKSVNPPVSTPQPPTQVSIPQPHPTQPPKPTPSYPRARAIWAYNEGGKEPNDLIMSAGDVVEIVEETNADWWTGRNKGKEGLFPSNYVEKLPPERSSQPHKEKLYGAEGYSNPGNLPPQQPHLSPIDDTPAVNSVGLQPDEGQDKKKKKFGRFGNTMAQSAAGGIGFGAGAAVGSGIINALF